MNELRSPFGAKFNDLPGSDHRAGGAGTRGSGGDAPPQALLPQSSMPVQHQQCWEMDKAACIARAAPGVRQELVGRARRVPSWPCRRGWLRGRAGGRDVAQRVVWSATAGGFDSKISNDPDFWDG